MRLVLVTILVMVSTVQSRAQAVVDLIGTVGGQSGYKVPYVEGAVESRYLFPHFLVGGDVRVASGRKVDTGDGFHLGLRGVAAYRWREWAFGGGYVYAHQWTSAYDKSGARPVAYVRWDDAEGETEVEGQWIFQGNDRRNGVHGAEVRYTQFTRLLHGRLGVRFNFDIYRAYQTDQPDRPATVGGAGVGLLYRAKGPVNPGRPRSAKFKHLTARQDHGIMADAVTLSTLRRGGGLCGPPIGALYREKEGYNEMSPIAAPARRAVNAPPAQGVSIRPSDATHGTGLPDDIDVRFTDVKFMTYDYDGKSQKPSLTLAVEMTHQGAEGEESFIQYYSAGDLQHFVPSEDGKRAIPAGNKTGLNDNCNAILFLTSLVNSGFPEDRLGDDVTVLIGTEAHINRVAQPKRAGLDNAGGKDRTIALVSKVNRLPWEAAKGKVGGGVVKPNGSAARVASAPAAAPVAAATPPAVDEDLAGLVTATIMGLLEGGPLPKARVTTGVFGALKGEPIPVRQAAVKLAGDNGFLESSEVWMFDGATLTLVS